MDTVKLVEKHWRLSETTHSRKKYFTPTIAACIGLVMAVCQLTRPMDRFYDKRPLG